MATDATLQALGDPSRRTIVELLCERERSVGELVEALELSQPGVSRHLRVLREAGLVESRAEAQRRLYQANPAPLEELDRWLAARRRRWTAHLDQLEGHLASRRRR